MLLAAGGLYANFWNRQSGGFIGVEEIAALAFQVNQTSQNIGARRLYTLLEKLLEDVSFQAPDKKLKKVKVDSVYVKEKLDEATRTEDLDRFIL